MNRKQALFLVCLPVLLALTALDWIAERLDVLGRKRFTPMPDGVGIKYVSVLYRNEGWLKQYE